MTATTIAFSGTLQSSIGTTYVSQPASDGCRPNSLHFHTLQERLMLVDCLQLCEIGASNSAQARRALDATKRTPSGMDMNSKVKELETPAKGCDELFTQTIQIRSLHRRQNLFYFFPATSASLQTPVVSPTTVISVVHCNLPS
jgi:hypothetical protein